LPASFLVVIELAEVGDGVLPRAGLGTHTFDEGVVLRRCEICSITINREN
jgi:hypothetical protein